MGDTQVTVSEDPAPVVEPAPPIDAAVTAVAETTRDATEAANANEQATAAADEASYSAATASESSTVAAEAANQANDALSGVMSAIDAIPARVAEGFQTFLEKLNAQSTSPLPVSNAEPAPVVEPDSAQHWLNKPLFKRGS